MICPNCHRERRSWDSPCTCPQGRCGSCGHVHGTNCGPCSDLFRSNPEFWDEHTPCRFTDFVSELVTRQIESLDGENVR